MIAEDSAVREEAEAPVTSALDRPTIGERVILGLHLGYALDCLVLALLLEVVLPLGGIALDLGSLDAAVRQAFPGGSFLESMREVLLAGFGVAFYVFLFFVIGNTRRRLLAARSTIAPLLVGGPETFNRVFGEVHRKLPVLGLTFAFGIVFVFPGWSGPASPGIFQVGAMAVQLTLQCFLDACALWVFFCALRGLHRLGKEELKLVPYYEDKMLGLGPLGSLSIVTSFLYFALVSLTIPQVLLSSAAPSPLLLAFLAFLFLFGAAMFILPLLRIHGLMVEEKRRAEAEVRRQASRFHAIGGATSNPDPNSEAGMPHLLADLRELLVSQSAERKIAELRTWPFDAAVVRRIAAITATGITVIVGRGLIDFLLH